MDVGDLLIGGGGGGILVAAAQAIINRKKLGADTASILSKAAIELVKPLSDRIHELEQEVDTLRSRVRETTDELDRCRARERVNHRQIYHLGGVPETSPGG